MIGSFATLLILLAGPDTPPAAPPAAPSATVPAPAPPAAAATPVAIPPGPVPADLLKKLAESDARLMRVYKENSVTMTSKVEEVDKAGAVEHSQEVVYRLFQKDGKPQAEVVRATRDGKDITEDERKKQEEQREKAEREPQPKGGGKGQRKMELTTPFAAEAQPSYAFQVLGPDAHDARLLRVGFGPRGKPSKDLWVGEAVIDPETGSLRWMKERPSDLPAFVDRMEMVLEFNASVDEGYAISTIHMQGEGGLPLFKKRFRVLTKFSDYGSK